MDKRQVQDGILKSRSNNTAREHLAAFFIHLDKIKPVEDDGGENDLADYINNNSDGVACKLSSDLDDVQYQKLATIARNLRDLRDLLPENTVDEMSLQPADTEPANTEVVPAVPVAALPLVVPINAAINARGRYGYTRLTEATANGNLELVKQLFKDGARYDIPDNWGQTAWSKAYAFGLDEILRVFDPKFVRTEPVPHFNYND